MEFVIKTEHLTKDFGTFVLEDVSFALPGGTIMGLIGENGAGKSTLLKCLTGALRPTSGRAEVLGGAPGDALDQVGFVPDTCPFAGMLTVEQVGKVMAGMFPAWDDALFGKYTRRFELSGKQKVSKLSRGMGMKLSIAAALSHRPRLLILDEATAGLDPVVRDEMLDIFMGFIADEDHAVLISSHITSDLEKACDYVTYLHKGKLTLTGEKDELLSRYGKVECSREQLGAIDPGILVGQRVSQYRCQALVSDRRALERALPGAAVEPPTLEDIMIFTTRGQEP